MTKKPTLTSITSGFASNTQLNNNFQLLRDAFDNTLSLDGSTPNAMNADLDLNGNSINNVGDLGITGELTIDGQVVTSVLTVPDWKGEWATGNAYALNDLVRHEGSAYIVKVAHTSGTFSADQSAGKLELFAEKGSAGAGTGDMLTTNNLSDLTDTAQALVNLGVSATATELNYVDGVTSNVQTQLDAKAPLASPALTGTPTAPTAAAGTNTTQVATTAFVNENQGKFPYKNVQLFTASGTWTVPTGVTQAFVMCSGGGGGGGAGNSASNKGGNGGVGGSGSNLLTVSGSVTVTIGASGAGSNTDNVSGSAGGTTSFSTLSATGGTGGIFGTSGGNGANGTSGTVSGGASGSLLTFFAYAIPTTGILTGLIDAGIAFRPNATSSTAAIAYSLGGGLRAGAGGTGETSGTAANATGGVGGSVWIFW